MTFAQMLLPVLDPLVSVAGILVMFSSFILVHEYGHFWVAKKSGITVEVFSLGFGPRLLRWKRGGTVYQVCLIPFGGFVRMAGEDYSEHTQPQPNEYMGKPPGIRALVVAAGSVHNLLFGLVLLVPVFILGVPGYDGTKIGGFEQGLPAARSGLQVGDEVIAVNGEACRTWFDVTQRIRHAAKEDPAKPVVITVRRAGQELSVSVVPQQHEGIDASGRKALVYMIGIAPSEKMEKYSFPVACVRAGQEFGKMTYGIGLAFKLLFTRKVSPSALAGPVGIAQWTAQVTHAGIAKYLYFLAFISINLGYINLLPFPVLDGGHLVGLAAERVTRRRPRRRFLEAVQYGGLVLILCLALYVTYNDLLRIAEEKQQLLRMRQQEQSQPVR